MIYLILTKTGEIMGNIKVFDHSIHSIGYISRTITYGEEYEMVKKYINYFIRSKKHLSKKNFAIFIEPQIDTGYPDIVIVDYYETKDISWIDERNYLSNNDLRILFEIQKKKTISVDALEGLLGFTKNDLEKSILRLSKSNMVHTNKHNSKIRSAKFKSYCRINNIISIEAKIDKWNEAIRQATNNTWFATESYILMKKDRCNEAIMNVCKERGIGIILMNGKITCKLRSEKQSMPVSYSSLQFNEWILREQFSRI